MKKLVCLMASFVCAAILLSVNFSVESSQAADNSKFGIAYSGNIMGYFESCG
ncbi:MAG: hypothetical protein JXR49_10905 [Acidobacteria bacterium]|nr:hypothetical protein [Acidobacteriota bacterium]